MTKTNNIAAKLSIAFVAIAMAFTFALPARAQDVSSMSLQDLIELVNQLQAQLSGSATVGSCSYTFTRSLGQGSTGVDVMNLQKFLNMSADTQVAVAGSAGSPGMETSYYGPATAAAVSKFQVKYSSEILVPVGLVSPTGYFGPSSMAQANDLCVAMTDDNDDDDSSDNSGDLEGGAGDISIDQTSSDIEDEVLEGEEDVQVLGFDVEADDSDVRLTNVEVEFQYQGSSAGSDNLDRYIEEVTIWLDGEMVGSADVDDFDEDNDVYSENISLDDAVIREGDEERLYVAVTAEGNIDSDDLGKNWEVAIDDIRFRDGSGAVLTNNDGGGVAGSKSETFTFEDLSTSGDIELNVREDDDDINRSHIVPVDETSDTNDVELLSFTIEAEGSDMTVNDLYIDIDSSGAGITEIANDFRLLMDGKEVGDFGYDKDEDGNTGDSMASSTDASARLYFTDLDDDDVMIDEGDEVTFTLVADINDIDGNFGNGDYFSAISLASANVDADDENGDQVTDLNGTADSTNISFRASGVAAVLKSSSASQSLGLDSTSSDDQGVFTAEFEVTAFGETAWVELNAASSTTASTSNVGIAYIIEDSSNNAVGGGSVTESLARVSGGTVSGNFVKINEGQTATLRLTVYYDAAATGIYRVQAKEIGFNQTSAADADMAQVAMPEEDFQSDSVQVKN